MAQDQWMEQLKTLAAQRAAGGGAGQPQQGAESGAPPFTWKLEVKGQGPQGMPMIPGAQQGPPGQAPPGQGPGGPAGSTPEEKARRRSAGVGLMALARRSGVQPPSMQGGTPGQPQQDPNAMYAQLNNASLQPVAQGQQRDQALQALMAGAGRA